MTDTQNKLVLHWLMKYESITAIQAIKAYGITRLSARIYDLERKGHRIEKQVIHDAVNPSRHWTQYSLQKPVK